MDTLPIAQDMVTILLLNNNYTWKSVNNCAIDIHFVNKWFIRGLWLVEKLKKVCVWWEYQVHLCHPCSADCIFNAENKQKNKHFLI